MLLLLFFYFFSSLFAVNSTKPNVVIILADDMGWADAGFHSSDIPTPNIDALAYSGIILNRHYAQPSCSPSRAALLTGKYPLRLGIQSPIAAPERIGLPVNEKIMPEYFKDLGYSTSLVGKWHLGFYTKAHLPNSRGFDSFFGFLNGYLGHYDGVHNPGDVAGIDSWINTTRSWSTFHTKYLPELLSEEACRQIKDHGQKRKDGLFMMVSSCLPHTGNLPLGLEPPPRGHGDTFRKLGRNRQIYADMVMWLDETVGNITEALKDAGMLDNTILVFMSDNGAPATDPIWHYDNGGSNWPLRGEKMSVHEGGIRTLSTIWSKNLTSVPRVHNNLFHITDWLPTLYNAVGGDSNQLLIDGVNQWKSITNASQDVQRDFSILDLDSNRETEGLIKGNWKLVKDGFYGSDTRVHLENNFSDIKASKVYSALGVVDEFTCDQLRGKATVVCSCISEVGCQSHCLFDIIKDPCECNDLSSTYPDTKKELLAILDSYRIHELKMKPAPENLVPDVFNYWSSSANLIHHKLEIFVIILLCFLI